MPKRFRSLLDLEEYLEKRSQETLQELAEVSPQNLQSFQARYKVYQELLLLLRESLRSDNLDNP